MSNIKIGETLSYIDKLITSKIELIKNKYRYTMKFQNKFEYTIQKEFFKQYQQFGTTQLYQTHPEFKVLGTRPTISRFKTYNLEKYITKKTEVIDFGSNLGFFSLYLSKFVKSVDLVELNTTLTKICRMAKHKLNISNVNIWNGDIKKYKCAKKYDLVVSFAIHGWVGIPLDKYINLLLSYLKPKGILLIESHALPEDKKLGLFLKNKKGIKIIEKGIIDDHDGILREFFYIKKVK